MFTCTLNMYPLYVSGYCITLSALVLLSRAIAIGHCYSTGLGGHYENVSYVCLYYVYLLSGSE